MPGSTGIYPKNGSYNVAALFGSRKKPRVKFMGRVESSVGALGELFKEKGISRKGVVLALPAEHATIRKTTLPLKNVAQIRRTVRFQVERYLPGVSPEDAVVDFVVIGTRLEGTDIVLVIVAKDVLERELARLKEAGIEPDAVTVDFAAEFNVLLSGGAFEESGRTAAVVFAGSNFQILLSDGGKFLHVRNLPLGGGVDSGLAARIAKEIEYSWIAAGFEGKGDRAVLSGAVPPTLSADALERELGCEVATFNPASVLHQSTDKETETEARRMTGALGAALRPSGRGTLYINLGREEQAYRGTYEIIRKPLVLAAVLLILFLGVELVKTIEAGAKSAEYYERLKKEGRTWYSKVMKGKKTRFPLSSFHTKIKNMAARGVGQGSGAAWPSFLDFMQTLAANMPADERTVIYTVSFKDRKAFLRGTSDDRDAFEKLAKTLEDARSEKTGRKLFNVETSDRMRGRKKLGQKLSFTIELTPGS